MEDTFHQLLRQKGRSVTRSRTLLFRYLQTSGAVSPRQFGEDNRAIADRASLYRALALFRQLGVVEDRLVGSQRLIELSDIFDSHHHHFSCQACGTMITLVMPRIEESLEALCAEQGLRIQGHTIEITGLCANCNLKNQ